MAETPTARRNVALLMKHEPAMEDRCIRWSEHIAKQLQSDIVLNRDSMHAHISLYNVVYPLDNLAAVEQALATMTLECVPIDVRFHATSRVQEYVFLDAVVSDELRDMHERIIVALNPLRQGQAPEGLMEAAGDNVEWQQNIRETGMMLSRASFQPHVTLAHLQNETSADTALTLLPQTLRGFKLRTTVPSLHLVETGPHGTCKSIVREFPLGKKP